jgi:predicted AlkP superfamily phosphohydrolase/phosphomutase
MGLFRSLRKRKKVFVIGLDCAAPELIFHRWKNDLPNLSHLMDNGIWGELESSIPAITVPAWSSMLSSRDPGVLGIYGFRNRADYSYDKMTIAMGNMVNEKRVWNYLSEAGLQSIVIGVPQTYPIRPLKGHLISGFLTPNNKSDFTYPYSFRKEVLSISPDYDFDVKDFRTDDKDWLLKQIYIMTDKHFAVVDYALKNKPWDFFMFMEIGVDRIHHGFWHCHDPEHFRYEKGNPYENAIHDYYVYIDKKIGEWLSRLDDNTSVLVVSDHGAKRMDGGICINEWLWRNGYLAFKREPTAGEIVSFEKMEIDWSKTKAWGSGGYYGRLFLNVKGREPQGVIQQSEYEKVRDELISKLTKITDTNNKNIGTRVFKPQEIYQRVNRIAPDLIIYFGDLYWRSVGSLGYDGWHTFENDTGPDSCNHAQHGMFILSYMQNIQTNHGFSGGQLMDIAPTILKLSDVPLPSYLQGRAIFQ